MEPGLAALQELQRAPPPEFANAVSAALRPGARLAAVSDAGAVPPAMPAAASAPAVSAELSAGLLRQLRGSSFEVVSTCIGRGRTLSMLQSSCTSLTAECIWVPAGLVLILKRPPQHACSTRFDQTCVISIQARRAISDMRIVPAACDLTVVVLLHCRRA